MSYKLKNDAVCGVIGYGSWATALTHTLISNGQKIWWHIRNPEVLESIQTEGRNAKYLNDIEFNKESINATADINEVVRNCEVILIAAPSAFLTKVMSELTESLENKFILSATKGIVNEEYTITEYSDNETNALHNGNPYDKIIENGKVPYYCTAWSNIASRNTAIKAGFIPSWVEIASVGSL